MGIWRQTEAGLQIPCQTGPAAALAMPMFHSASRAVCAEAPAPALPPHVANVLQGSVSRMACLWQSCAQCCAPWQRCSPITSEGHPQAKVGESPGTQPAFSPSARRRVSGAAEPRRFFPSLLDSAGMPVPVRIYGGGTCEFQTMPARHKHPAGFSLRPHGGCPSAVPGGARGSSAAAGGGARGRAVRSLIRACQSAGRHPLQIAAATFVPVPLGMVAREAAPGTACADRSAASAAAGGLVACYQNPWQEGGNELSPPLSQPPHSQQSLWMARLCILRPHKIS